jgi:hypothetical protein
MKSPVPLHQRIFHYKNPQLVFYCPLCRTKRETLYSSKPTRKNLLQILVTGSFFSFLFYPLMKERSIIILFIVWIFWEAIRKILFRQEIPCPHCGFDAVWYKRNVKKARELVGDFWKAQAPPKSEI